MIGTPLAYTRDMVLESDTFIRFSKYGNWLLIGGVAAVLCMLILPLPTLLLDFLLAVNLTASLTLMLVAIFMANPMQLATFPTMLLIATMFRLGLNIASTRLILTHGDAGHIIETFGRFVTGGNLAVGLVVFFILTLIQFIVVAKGSERVAEVGARFTLDAMPGKQMSIDADLRAGLIGQEEAKAQREALHRESKMYGAMDGAMKFVKGDAIAGLIITVVNLIGGFFMGMFSRGMDFQAAVQTYSILSIGDGLVSQIPALLVSMTAGFVVTRVASGAQERALGTEMGMQILAQPQALFVASGLAVLLGLLPGFPLFLFILIGACLFGTAFYFVRQVQIQQRKAKPLEHFVLNSQKRLQSGNFQAVPLVLEVGNELYRIFEQDPKWQHFFGTLYPKLRLFLSQDLGIAFPDLYLTINPTLSQSFRYQIKLYEIPVDYGILNPHHVSILGNKLPQTGEKPERTTETVHGTKLSLWTAEKRKALEQNGLTPYGPDEMLLRHLAKVLKRNAGEFIGIQEIRNLLQQLEATHVDLVREVVPKMMSIQKLTEIIKRLVEEGIPIKDFRLILQTLSTCQPETKDPVTLQEQVRMGLRRLITHLHVKNGNRLSVFTIDPEIEDEIRGGIQKTGSESYLALSPDRIQAILESCRKTIAQAGQFAADCVLLTQVDVRRYLRKIIETDLESLSVLSYQELDPKVVIQSLGTISVQ